MTLRGASALKIFLSPEGNHLSETPFKFASSETPPPECGYPFGVSPNSPQLLLGSLSALNGAFSFPTNDLKSDCYTE